MKKCVSGEDAGGTGMTLDAFISDGTVTSSKLKTTVIRRVSSC